MKRTALMLALIMMALSCSLTGAGAESYRTENVLRLHVIANSDSTSDQRAKLYVRDALLAYERSRLLDADVNADVRELLLSDGDALVEVVEAALAECGKHYGCTLYSGEFAFPERDYMGTVYPEGDYEALRVVLGKGKGENWWCVMFPPLCILELPGGDADHEAENGDAVQFESLIIKLIRSIGGGKLWRISRGSAR